MQNKGMVRLFAIALALVCVYQLSFTFKARQVENDAKDYPAGEKVYLDSIAGEKVFDLGIRDYTYREVKEREINLGLDLKGGMNVTLEISVVELIEALSNHSQDSTFLAAIEIAKERQKDSQEDFVSLFGSAYEELDPNAKLAANFLTPELKDRINYNSSNSDVLKVIKAETNNAIDNSFNILRTRIDHLGVAQPNIQKLPQHGRILVELPGVTDQQRVRKLLQGTASLEFWETYENEELYGSLIEANNVLKDMFKTEEDVAVENGEEVAEEPADSTSEQSLLDELAESDADTTSAATDMAKDFPLFAVLIPSTSRDGQLMPGPVVGYAHTKDRDKVMEYLAMPKVKQSFPRNVVFHWGMKPFDEAGNFYQLFALKVTTRDGSAPLDGGSVTDARQDFEQGSSAASVNFALNSEGAKTWARMTKDNLKRSIAIVLDDYVVSYPTVQVEITGGRSDITGNFTIEEAQDLANMLKSGKMPAPARIMQEQVVGPSLGQESINSGLWSFVIAFVLVLLYMLFIYSGYAGTVANLALIANLFFVVGVLASFGAVLTLPGIAGIVLTIGMSVDANVLIYERIQEELKAGKGLRLAITDGYRNAYSAIIDGQLTTLLTGIVLYFFGSGPIKGFATTLIIGILTSLFSAIFITRLTFERWLDKDRKIKFASTMTDNWLRNSKINFLGKRKTFYVISAVAIVISIGSLAVRGLDYGIDFKGGRTFVVEFDEDVNVSEVSEALAVAYGAAPEVKTYGGANQVRITTDYRISESSEEVDNEVENLLFEGLKPVIGDMSKAEFDDVHLRETSKVGPTISDDIRRDAVISILFALIIIFLYILVRFRNWQYGLGAVAALAHDSIIVLGVFSLFSGILPFSLEIDQAFIAAILTVLGYSINDTVVVFDRIREFLHLYPKRDRIQNNNNALNSTLRRTFSTSISTFVVLLAIFLFGGATIRGFTFALLVGVVIGTYSSLFIATPIAFDTQKRVNKIKNRRN